MFKSVELRNTFYTDSGTLLEFAGVCIVILGFTEQFYFNGVCIIGYMHTEDRFVVSYIATVLNLDDLARYDYR